MLLKNVIKNNENRNLITGTGRKWIFKDYDHTLAKQYSETYGLSILSASILAGRDISNFCNSQVGGCSHLSELLDIQDFVNPKLKNLLQGDITLPDGEACIDRLYQAVTNSETIGIFGDYDVDGLCASSMFVDFLKKLNAKYHAWVPQRDDGYGLSKDGIDFLKNKGIKLLLVLDCGSSSTEIVNSLQEEGIDVLIIDHHQIVNTPPKPKAFVNPFRHDVSYKTIKKYQHLCATGLCFLVIILFAKKYKDKLPDLNTQELLNYTVYAALATVCDVMSLKNLINRAMIKTGLQVLARREHIGLTALMEVLNLPKVLHANHLGFCIGPRLNAAARMNLVSIAFQLLTTQCAIEAYDCAKKLDDLNVQRRNVEESFMSKAMQQAEMQKDKQSLIIVGDNWHIGVIGIIASNLKEIYCKPTIVISFQEGENGEIIGRGSARSVDGIDIGRLFQQALEKGILVSGGGHILAAGLSIKKNKIHAFSHFVETVLQSSKFHYEPFFAIDAVSTLDGFTVTKDITRIAPFGCDFTNPKICVTDVVIKSISPYKMHSLVFVSQGSVNSSFLAFRTHNTPFGKALVDSVGKTVNILLNISDNGQTHLEDIAW